MLNGLPDGRRARADQGTRAEGERRHKDVEEPCDGDLASNSASALTEEVSFSPQVSHESLHSISPHGSPKSNSFLCRPHRHSTSSVSSHGQDENAENCFATEDNFDAERVRRRSFDARTLCNERVGSLISGRYDIEKHEIGVGGYGKVYLAKDRMFKDRLVAIKKVAKVDEEKIVAFKREVKIMKDLDHPSICRLFETYDQDRFMFFVIEYCPGGDLYDRLSESESGRMAEPCAAQIVKQVSSALKYAHVHGIAHRDLKLENICFCDREEDYEEDCERERTHVKVIDWGLGKYFNEGRMKSMVGTSTYSAPEVLDVDEMSGDEGYTSACDIWSLGVVAYVTICGKPPFWGSPQEALRRMRKEQYPLAEGIWESVSPEAKDFIRLLLKSDPRERLSLDGILAHPWFQIHSAAQVAMDPLIVEKVLSNLEHFSHAPDFFSICVASVARQLDHCHLKDIHEVFCELDSNGDGALSLLEVRAGFERVFGTDSEEFREVGEIFSRLDLDCTGVLSYTEFCAAGLDERYYSQEHVLWAAFKSFDIHDDGRISKGELQEVLCNADVSRVWSKNVCEEVAADVMEEFGGTDGTINFGEWLQLMRECAYRHERGSPRKISSADISARKASRDVGHNNPFLSVRKSLFISGSSFCCVDGISRCVRRMCATK